MRAIKLSKAQQSRLDMLRTKAFVLVSDKSIVNSAAYRDLLETWTEVLNGDYRKDHDCPALWVRNVPQSSD